MPSISNNVRSATFAYQLTHFDSIAAKLAALEKIKATRKKINRKSNLKIKKYATRRMRGRKKGVIYIKKIWFGPHCQLSLIAWQALNGRRPNYLKNAYKVNA